MLDFEAMFDGLGGKVKHARKKQIKVVARAQAKARKPLGAPSLKVSGEIEPKIRFMAPRPAKPKPKTLQEVAANKPPVRTHGPKVKVKVKTKAKASPRVTAAFDRAKQVRPEKRPGIAARVMLPVVRKVAKKAKAKVTPAPKDVAKKAILAVKPVAQACSCQAAPVVRKLDAHLVKDGYPSGTAANVLAEIHDMNARLEKAALQRMATHEHKSLTAKHDFEHEVLTRLAAIATCLPPCHPTRARAFLSVFRKG